MEKVVVGMSGGIDSLVTALMLQQQGYEVIGVTLEVWEKNDIEEVEKICQTLNIPLIVRKGEDVFRQMVVETFVEGYLSGLTPSPCCVCNSFVKWELLKQAMLELKADFLATGHYVSVIRKGKNFYIQQGKDIQKDQSYFLWNMSQDILSRVITPLGNYTKQEVRNWALVHGYENMVRRKESMGICFLKGTDYRTFIRQYTGKRQGQESGDIVDRTGQLLGKHEGLLNYTIGQKKGMPLMEGEPLYVAEMDCQRNVIVADKKSGLWTSKLHVGQVKLVNEEDFYAADVTVKVRGLGLNPKEYVRAEKRQEGKWRVLLSDPAWAVAPGQPVAFYRGNILIGGGIAEKVIEDQ